MRTTQYHISNKDYFNGLLKKNCISRKLKKRFVFYTHIRPGLGTPPVLFI